MMTKILAFKDGIQIQNIDYEDLSYGFEQIRILCPDCVYFCFPNDGAMPQGVIDYIDSFKPPVSDEP